MRDQDQWYAIRNVDAVDSPAFVVYPGRIRENVRRAAAAVPDVSLLRPHVKTNKTAEVSRILMGEGVTKFKCATIAEAEMLGMIGAADVLLAYQPVGPKVARLVELTARYPRTKFSCLVDDEAAAQAISNAFAQADRRINVFVDLNVGMNRTGVAPEDALPLYLLCDSLPGLEPVGLHAYDGHIRDADPAQRKEVCDAAFGPVAALRSRIEAQAKQPPVVVAGGTPTFPIHARRDGVECSPGTFVFHDWHYQIAFPDQDFLFAALLVTRVISKVGSRALCLDLGYKSVSSENPLPKRVRFLNAPDAEPLGHSEEHLVINVGDNARHSIGDVFYGVPYHVCPTCALHDKAHVVEDNRVTGSWDIIARARRIGV
jgi:D-threonine aldolase